MRLALKRFRLDGSHHVFENQLGEVFQLVIGRLGMRQSAVLPHADVAIWHDPVEIHSIVVLLLQGVQSSAVEVSQPPMPQNSVSCSLHFQLWRTAPLGEIQ